MPDESPPQATRVAESRNPSIESAYRLGKRYAETRAELKAAADRIAALEKEAAARPKSDEVGRWRAEALKIRHREAFDKVRKSAETKLRDDVPTDRLMGLLGLPTDSETPDEKAIAEGLAKLAASDPWLVAGAGAGAGSETPEGKTEPTVAEKLLADPFASRGKASEGSPASMTVRADQLGDPAWCHANHARMGEAIAAGTFKVLE